MARENPKGDYVYAHYRATDGKIFYVGKGRNRRIWRRDNRNFHWLNTVKKHGFTARVIMENMSHHCAETLERILIDAIGVKNLANIAGGGCGFRGAPMKQETKNKIQAKNGFPVWNDEGELFPSANAAARAMRDRGYPKASHSGIYAVTSGKSESCYGYSWSHKGVPEKPKNVGMLAVAEAKSVSVVCVDNGMVFKSAADAARWIELTSGKKASRSWIGACCRGEAKTSSGYRWKFKEA